MVWDVDVKPDPRPMHTRPMKKTASAYLVRASKGSECHSIPCMSLDQAKTMKTSYSDVGFACSIVPLFEVDQ
jgi:hypothetical protein